MFIKSFDKRFTEVINSMIKYSFKYVNFDKENVDAVYIYCSYEDGITNVGFFYKILNQYKKRSEVNFDRFNFNISFDSQLNVLNNISKKYKKLIELFKKYKKEVPTQLKIEFYPKTGKFNIKLDYELHWSNTDELLPEDIEDKWFEELKNNNA